MVTTRHLCIALLSIALTGCAARQTQLNDPALSVQSEAGARSTIRDLAQQGDATVLVFWSSGCPCVRRYQERIDALLQRYPSGRVRVVGISSNAGESFVQVLRTARERGVRIPIYRDEGGHLARAVGARTTPTVAVLDRSASLRFLGWIDNERLPGESGREAWLEDAIDGVLEGRGFQSRTPTYGCAITRSLFGASSSPCCSTPSPSRTTP